jgi:hypothetical protein
VERFNRDRNVAGIAPNVWARDLRASGISEEAYAALIRTPARSPDIAGQGRRRPSITRAVLNAADRFAKVWIRGRECSGNNSGNVW